MFSAWVVNCAVWSPSTNHTVYQGKLKVEAQGHKDNVALSLTSADSWVLLKRFGWLLCVSFSIPNQIPVEKVGKEVNIGEEPGPTMC